MSAATHLRRLLETVEVRQLTDRQDAVISAGALLLLDTITRSPQDMQERARVLVELMGD